MTRLRDLEEDHRLNKVYALAKKGTPIDLLVN